MASFDDPEFFGEHRAGIYDAGPGPDPMPAVAGRSESHVSVDRLPAGS